MAQALQAAVAEAPAKAPAKAFSPRECRGEVALRIAPAAGCTSNAGD
jgi:hypothetical protein